jgi:hypothetical protein
MTDEDRARYRRRVYTLAAFGHRGSGTDHERRAADYLIGELRGLGVGAARETFRGSRSWARRHLLHVVIAAAGVGCLWHLPVLTAALAVAALVSFWAEGATRGAWLTRPLVRSASANVVARLTPLAATRLRVVVSGHYDTQRTGLIWIVAGWLAPLQWRLPVALKPPLLPLAGAMAAQVLAGGVALWGLSPPVTVAGCALLAVYAVYGVLLGQWAVGRFVPGAADNASGAAAVLALGEAWHRDPVAGVELVLLLTGCEETGLLGAAAWADRHRAEVRAVPTVFLNIDCVGMGPPRFLGWEVPVVGRPVAYPPAILATARAVAAEQGLVDAGPHSVPGPTDGLAFLKRGLPGVTVAGFRGRGHFPNYHRMSDTADAVDYEAACTGVEFAWALLRRLAHEADVARGLVR